MTFGCAPHVVVHAAFTPTFAFQKSSADRLWVAATPRWSCLQQFEFNRPAVGRFHLSVMTFDPNGQTFVEIVNNGWGGAK